MLIFLFIYIFLTTIFSIYCSFNKPKLFYIAKILPIIGLILFLSINMVITGKISTFSLLVLFAIIIGMFGDIFIISQKTFIFGLISFLITHVLYVVAFNLSGIVLNINMIIFVPIVLISLIFVIYLSFVMSKSDDKSLIIPVWVYVTVITVMIISSIGFTINNNLKLPLFIIASGFFFISDAVLSIKTFVSKKSEFLQIFILVFYYLAQTFFVVGTINL